MPPSEPVWLCLTVTYTAVGLQDTVEIGDFHGILSRCCALLKIAGQTTIVVGLRAEGSLDPPAYGQRREPLHLRWAGADLHVEIMTRRGSVHALARVDPIDLDTLGRPSVLCRPIQQCPAAGVSCTFAGVTSTASTKPSEQARTWRLIPLICLWPSTPRSPFCGPDTRLCESRMAVEGSAAWPCCWRTARVSTPLISDQIPSWRNRSCQVLTVSHGPKSLGR